MRLKNDTDETIEIESGETMHFRGSEDTVKIMASRQKIIAVREVKDNNGA